MRRMLDSLWHIRTLFDAAQFFWDYAFPVISITIAGFALYWAQDRTPAREFLYNEQLGTIGYITPNPVTAGMPATIHWYLDWKRNCDKVTLFQEITIDTKTAAPLVIRLEKIDVRSRSQTSIFTTPPPQWISREFYIPASANLCTNDRCEPVKAHYQSTLSDYCNPIHKIGFPITTESPEVEFTINPAVLLQPPPQRRDMK